MSLDINTNYSALYAQSMFSIYSDSLIQSLNMLNSAAVGANFSNPADVALAQVMQNTSSIYLQGMANAEQGVSLIQTATTGLQQTQNILQQMSTLATQSASGTLSSTQLSNIQTEYSQLQTEVDNIASTTMYNGISLLNNSNNSINIQVGSSALATNGVVTVNLPKTDTTSLGIATTSVSTAANASTAMTSITNALSNITSNISQLGSTQIVLQNSSTLDSNMALAASLANNSFISNAASASVQAATLSILARSNTIMLAQANAMSSLELQLLPQYNSGSYINLFA